MKTSYFSRYKESDGVSIAIKSIPGFTGPSYPLLYPNYSFLMKYKKDGDKEAYNEAYCRQVLGPLSPQKVYDELKDNTLLCWEKSGSFCHRRIVANWLEHKLGVIIPEV